MVCRARRQAFTPGTDLFATDHAFYRVEVLLGGIVGRAARARAEQGQKAGLQIAALAVQRHIDRAVRIGQQLLPCLRRGTRIGSNRRRRVFADNRRRDRVGNTAVQARADHQQAQAA
ncbi:hypothetical protein D3C85_1402580 [compost metagenome]